MGNLLAVLASFILICNGLQIFREPKEVGSGPLISCYIFMFSSFLLLYDLRLYPKSLRKLGRISQCFVEFLIASFLMENIMTDFWFPLEIVIMTALPKLADIVEDLLQSGNWSCETFCSFLKNETTGLVVSYMLSTFFLIAVLHAIRAIDLRALEDGPGCFFGDIFFRVKRFVKRKLKLLGFGGRRRVRIRESKNTCNVFSSSRPANKSKNYCQEEIDEDDEDPCITTNSDYDMGNDRD